MVRYGRNGGFVPGLADRWQVSEDSRALDIRSSGGLVFHDGSPCNAEAVCLSLRRMARADKGYTLGRARRLASVPRRCGDRGNGSA